MNMTNIGIGFCVYWLFFAFRLCHLGFPVWYTGSHFLGSCHFCLVMSFISYTPLNRLLHIGLFHFFRLRVTVASRVCSCCILHSKRQAILIHPPVTPVIFPRPYRAENTLKPGLHFPKTPILPLGYQPQPPWLPNHHNDRLVGFIQPFTHG